MEELDIGECQEHNRPYEGICQQCFTPVCPRCIMFSAAHKQHPVLELEEAISYFRSKLNEQLQRGKLKVDYTESVLLDIRQALLTCDQSKTKMVESTKDKFNTLIKALKQRKQQVVNDLEDLFNAEKSKILEKEELWNGKQKICEELLRLNSTVSSDAELLLNSRYITDGIDSLTKPIKFSEMKLVNSLDDNMHVSDEKGDADPSQESTLVHLTHEQVLGLLKEYLNVSEYKNLQYRA